MNRRRQDSSLDTQRLMPHLRGETVSTISIRVVEIIQAPAVIQIVTAGGDARALRGIPAVGRSVSGHVAGTHPEQALLDGLEETA